MIRYKSEWYGREFVQINQWFPSSKRCNVCGEINHSLGRDEREWECPHCHSINQRDINAAKNILDEALRATGSMVLCLVDFIPIGQDKFEYYYEWKGLDKTVGMA
jgi:putative transposase